MTATAEPTPIAAAPAAGTEGAARILHRLGDRTARPPELTIPEMLHHSVEHYTHKAALLYKKDDEWLTITYGELNRQVERLALGFIDLGVEAGARVALLSENRPEWAIVDLALTSIGSVNVPLYTTLPPPQVEYIVEDAGAQVLIVSNGKQLAKALEVRERLPELKHVVVMDPPAELPEGVLPLDDLYARADKRPGGEEFDRRRAAVRASDPATIIYTSGTTGAPKGAMLTHDNFMSNAQSAAPLFEVREDDLFLSFLPLSHVFERLAGHYFPLLVGASIAY
ncbi:MAG TPA: AMP-binding protein, partial [Armatimonadota bacterium]|nr:AMP-binding protein [Armatimonadota bacterium]